MLVYVLLENKCFLFIMVVRMTQCKKKQQLQHSYLFAQLQVK